MSVMSMITVFFGCIVISFHGGRLYHTHILLDSNIPVVDEIKEDIIPDVPSVTVFESENLKAVYTFKDFNVSGAGKVESIRPEIIVEDEGKDDEDDDDDDDDDDDEDEEEETELSGKNDVDTSGQSLRANIENLDPEMLKNEKDLIKIFINILEEGDLPGPLSYHCHALHVTGVSCVGILGNSPDRGHFFFYTWPEHGSISFDIATTPTNSLLTLVPIFKRIFGIEDLSDMTTCVLSDAESSTCSVDVLNKPRAVWKHRGFGYRKKERRLPALLNDISDEVLDSNPMDYIKEVVTTKSIFQQIDVYDFIDPKLGHNYTQTLLSLAGDDTYEAQHPELFLPERMVFLDGVSQSTRRSDEGYHETLVQPAMFAHPNPRRAAIIGGGEGATLREVLRHNTIDHVKMVEIDQVMVETSREFLPSWSDCSDLVGSTENCLDEPRADVIYKDAVAWFADRTFYPSDTKVKGDNNTDVEQFDVVIVDALDPQDTAEFSDVLYKDDAFLSSVYRSLSDDGIMVMQLGPAPAFEDPAEEYGAGENRVLIFKTLRRFGFASMQVYEEHHCGFEDAWAFVIACKDINCRDNWYASESEIDLNIHNRLIPTKSKKPSLKHFDGATMNKYQYSTHQWESVYCRSPFPHPACSSIDGYQSIDNIVTSDKFEVSKEGVVTKVDVKEGDLLMVDEQVHSVHFASKTVSILQSMKRKYKAFQPIIDFMNDYENKNALKYEANELHVPSSLMRFVKGDNSANVGNAFRESGQFSIGSGGVVNVNIYNPIVSRRFRQAIGTFKALKDISAGEVLVI